MSISSSRGSIQCTGGHARRFLCELTTPANAIVVSQTVDFPVKMRTRPLPSRPHPTLRRRIGDAIFVQLDSENRVVLKVI